MTANETRAEKARAMRYKKPIVTELNIESIRDFLGNILDECWTMEGLIEDDDTLLDAMEGNEEQAQEFRMMFADLENDCEQMQEDLDAAFYTDEQIQIFDLFFVCIQAGEFFGGYQGYDTLDKDYFGLESGWESRAAEEEAQKKIERMTKKDIIENARAAFKIYQGYIGLRNRYDNLEASFNILKDKSGGYYETLRAIEELYDRAEEGSSGFGWSTDDTKQLDRLLAVLPQEVWVW